MRYVRSLIALALVPVLLTGLTAACQPAVDAPDDSGEPAPVVEQPAGPGEAETSTGALEQAELEAVEGVPPECAEAPGCAVFAPGATIKIGFGGPMTGDSATFGIDISNAGKLAIADLGNVDGWAVALDVQDTMGTGEGGAAVANKFVSDQAVVAVAGHTFSGSAAAAIPIYNRARVPMLSGSATRADLTTGDQDVFNRIAFTDDVQGTNVANYLYERLDVRKLAVLHDGDAYGKGLAEKVRDVFTELGGEVVAFEAVAKGEADYSAPLNRVGALKPEALF